MSGLLAIAFCLHHIIHNPCNCDLKSLTGGKRSVLDQRTLPEMFMQLLQNKDCVGVLRGYRQYHYIIADTASRLIFHGEIRYQIRMRSVAI
jgi:hypothetical protein